MTTIIIQPKPNNKPPAAAAKPEAKRVRKYEDFSHEYLNLPVSIRLATNEVVSGLLIDGSRYWFKVRAVDGRIVYINKAYAVSVTPLQGEGKDAVKR